MFVTGALALPSAGCFTLGGTIIGASTSRDQEVRPEALVVDVGTPIRIVVKGTTIEGKFLRRTRDTLVIARNDEVEIEVRLSEVERVSVQAGSYWAAGLLSGLVVDAAVVVVLIVAQGGVGVGPR